MPSRRQNSRDEPGGQNAPWQTSPGTGGARGAREHEARHVSPLRKNDTRPTSERSDLWGVWGALPTSSLGPRPPSTPGTSPRLSPAGTVPATPTARARHQRRLALSVPHAFTAREEAWPAATTATAPLRDSRQAHAHQHGTDATRQPCARRRASEARAHPARGRLRPRRAFQWRWVSWSSIRSCIDFVAWHLVHNPWRLPRS